jgi:L-seryl-tRNA(Ser) seleniumtransferase
MTPDQTNALRQVPSVSALLGHEAIAAAADGIDERFLVQIIREEVARYRSRLQQAALAPDEAPEDVVIARLRQTFLPTPRPVINGTGVIIQTNLGRAPVSRATASAMMEAAQEYVALETELELGSRGGRGRAVDDLMRLLTGAERTLVVNNNAAAVLLVLSATCAGRDVIVSRGEAVEIGGGFRIPDVLRQSGARLVEVGTTNRTYLLDYEDAVSDTTAAFLRVHTSNFAIVGFTARPTVAELAARARERGVLMLEDAGSGCLLDTRRYGLPDEPTLGDAVSAGVDIVCASGDKLLGGPQAGLILGRRDVVDRIARHPLARAVRADKTCLAGVAATLQHYLRGEADQAIPVWQAISRPIDEVERRVRAWAQALGPAVGVVPTTVMVGGGSLPGSGLPSFALILTGAMPAEELAQRLRTGSTPVVPRIVDDAVAIDGRTVLDGQDEALLKAVRAAIA